MRYEEDPQFARFANRDTNCTFRTVQKTHCFTEVDKDGVPQRKCQRLLKKFKECPGLPTEVIEHVERDIDPGTDTNGSLFSKEEVFGGVGSDVKSMFSRLDGKLGSFGEKPFVPRMPQKDKSFRQKLGDYFTWEKDCQKQTGTSHKKKPSPEWKQFESDFQEI